MIGAGLVGISWCPTFFLNFKESPSGLALVEASVHYLPGLHFVPVPDPLGGVEEVFVIYTEESHNRVDAKLNHAESEVAVETVLKANCRGGPRRRLPLYLFVKKLPVFGKLRSLYIGV